MFKAVSRKVLATFVLTFSLSSLALAGFGNYGSTPYPTKPDPTMTPGQLCQFATRLRYPEHIKYCDRDVDPQTKWQVIKAYVAKFGYNINSSNRMSFKIDHYIPLCMGGSNDVSNLWPQHMSVYQQTDPLEPLMCEKMASGRLKQAEAVELIKKGKNDFSQIRGIISYLNGL
jgi:hypothetical protein